MSLQDDEKLADFRKAIENGEYSLNARRDIKDIKNINVIRKVRELNSEEIREINNMFIDAVINNQVTRSRIVEIKLNASNLDIRI